MKNLELVLVGQKAVALEHLHTALTAKRQRGVWQPVMEDIAMLYVDLCVELRKARLSRDGLSSYRNMSQTPSISSLQKVMEHLLAKAQECAREAQEKADQKTLSIDDLDEETPESLALTLVSGESAKDRTDREMVTPWLKFLWETYRNILDILRFVSRLEPLYKATCRSAFEFCLKFKRTNEFKRLSENLRNHLLAIQKMKNNPMPNQSQQVLPLSTPDSVQQHLDIRFSQLETAAALELWQEAFRSIEDIQGLMSLSEVPLKPQLMATFYEKLSQIFWVSHHLLFYSNIWFKLLVLNKTLKKTLTEEEARTMASHVLLGALAVPLDRRMGTCMDTDPAKERLRRMADMLNFTVALSREQHLAELVSKGLLTMVPPEVLAIYQLLEREFCPLELRVRFEAALDALEPRPDLHKYRPLLREVLVTRVLVQLSRVYDVVTLEDLQRLTGIVALPALERALVRAVREGHVVARLHHRDRAVHFDTKLFATETVRTQLTRLAANLRRVFVLIRPELVAQRAERRRALVAEVLARLPEEQAAVAQRKNLIERLKVEAEKAAERQAAEEAERAEQARLAAKEQERQRQIAEAKKREEERLRREAEEAELKAHLQQVAAMNLKIKEEDLKKADAAARRALLEKKALEQRREQEEAERRVQKQLQHNNHVVRALREAECAPLRAALEKADIDGRAFHERQVSTYLENHRKKYEHALATKQRLAVMQAERANFMAMIAARRADYVAREEERRRQEEEEERRRQEEEERRRQEEEEERRKEEEEEQRRYEEEEQRRYEEEQAARAAEDREMEARRQAREEEERRVREEERQAREEEERRAKEPPKKLTWSEMRKLKAQQGGGDAPMRTAPPAPERRAEPPPPQAEEPEPVRRFRPSQPAAPEQQPPQQRTWTRPPPQPALRPAPAQDDEGDGFTTVGKDGRAR